jgi:autotransporter-like protein
MMMTYSAKSKSMLLGGVAFLALAASANAQSINTIPQWDGVQFISSWGVPNTATYGQTITPTVGQTRLSSFTFQLNQTSGTAPQYQAFVFQWDATNQRIIGPALFGSSVFTAPGSGFSPVTINTGNVVLTPGQQYVLFLTTSTIGGQPNSSYRYGSVANTAYGGGQFVFQNNGSNFNNLSTVGWSTIGQDLAFQAIMSATNVGENHAQAQSGAFQLGNSYLSLLTDPMATNKVSTATGPLGYAAEKKLSPAVRAANAAFKALPPPVPVFVPQWEVWGAAFGGINNTKGDAAAATSDLYTRVGGVAAGADYRFAPDSLIGFSLAGGNINWTVNSATVAGGGSSDTFMAGIYGKYGFGAGYLSGAATYTNYWMKTDRMSFPGAGDLFRANFDAESWGGRLEGGYRAGQYWAINWTPYAAIQGQSFRTPNYVETVEVGAAANALTVSGRTATAFRGEVGLRSDKIFAVDNGGQLNLFGKFAYAHDEISNPQANVAFAAIGGIGGAAPFTVFGTRPSRDLALTTAGAEWRLTNGVSFLVKFDGEFGDRSETYSGTGRIRYTW